MREAYLFILLVAVSITGLVFPAELREYKGLIIPLLTLIMLSMGLTLTLEDFRRILTKPYPILYGALLQYSVMPLAGFAVAFLLGMDRDTITGFVLVGSAPGGTASNLITYLSGGVLAYSISMTTLSTMLSPVFTPLWTWFLVGQMVHVPLLPMMVSTAKIVILPVLLGMALRVFAGEGVRRVEPLLPFISVLAIGFIIAVIFALNSERLTSISLLVLAGVLAHNLLGFALGYLLGKVAGMNPAMRKTLAIEVGMQNSGLSAVLAVKHFSLAASLPSAVFSLSQNVIGMVIALLSSLRSKPE